MLAATGTRCANGTTIVLGFSGIACSIYACLSCEWFAWTRATTSSTLDSQWQQDAELLNNETGFVSGVDSVGIFRYRTFDIDDQAAECVTYNSLFASSQAVDSASGNGWLYAAQWCVVLGPTLAALAILANVIFYQRFTAACLWLLATGIQTAGALAATALCSGEESGYWTCPWLQGAHANAGAGVCFLICWLVSVCGYQSGTITLLASQHHFHDNASKYSGSTDGSMERSGGIDGMEDVELGEAKMTAEELLGTCDPIIHRAVAQSAKAIKEFARSSEEEDKLEMDESPMAVTNEPE